MTGREVARFVNDAMTRKARQTSANERGKVVQTLPSGMIEVDYRGQTVSVPNVGREFGDGESITLARVSGTLQLVSSSGYRS